MSDNQQFLGFGLGLRTNHYQEIVEKKPQTIDWFEILTENYLVEGGRPLYFLDKIAADYPIVMHGVSMSLGSVDPFDWDYLQAVKTLKKRVNARWLSDHLCWTGVKTLNAHDLLPLPLTEEALSHMVSRIHVIQEFMEEPILIENPSSYVTFSDDVIPESEFMAQLTKRSGCHLLLDVNNVYVSSYNHGFDAYAYIDAIPANQVKQIHLAGHTNKGNHIIDTHDHPIIDPVWDLYAYAMRSLGKIPTMIERDDNIPPLNDLIKELAQAKKIAESAWMERVA